MSDDNDRPLAPGSGTSASEARMMVMQFIKDVQPRALRSKQKEHITAFAKWYFSKKPVLADSDISYLLLGDGDSKRGLLESCGNSNLKRIGDIKNSSVLALELVVLLVDATVNVHADRFLDFLPRLSLKHVQSMKLDRHLLSDTCAPDNACKILFLLAEQLPKYTVSEFVDGNKEAERTYREWLAEHMDETLVGGDDVLGGEERGPRTWAEVVLEDLDREESVAMGMGGVGGVDLDAVLDVGSSATGGAAGEDEQETIDPLGLTRITLNARGHLLVNRKMAGSGQGGKGASSSKKMKLFWKKLLKHKEASEAAQKRDGGAAAGRGRTASTVGGEGHQGGGGLLGPNSPSASPSALADEEDDEGDKLHLMDAIMQHTGSINTTLGDFNPILFLTTVHSGTSLAQLEQGLTRLQASVSSRTSQMKSLVQQHFGQYVLCKDTIDHLHALLQGELSRNDRVAQSSGRSARLLRDIESVRQQMEELYKPLLERKTESEQIRQVLAVLARFKFLFALPGKLDESRRKQNWEQVIRDYQKAKQLVVIKQNNNANASTGAGAASGPTSPQAGQAATNPASANAANSAANSTSSVSLLSLSSTPSAMASTAAAAASGSLGIPESILFEIARLMREVRAELFRLLDTPQTGLDVQSRRIGYLMALDCEEDPAWYYLGKQRDYIASCLQGAMEEHCANLEQLLASTTVMKSFVPSFASTTPAAAFYTNSNTSSSSSSTGSSSSSSSSSNPSRAYRPTLAVSTAAATSPLRLLDGNIPLHLLSIQSPETVASLSRLVRKLCQILGGTRAAGAGAAAGGLPQFFELGARIERGEFGTFRPPGGAGAGAAAIAAAAGTGGKGEAEGGKDAPHLAAHRGSLNEASSGGGGGSKNMLSPSSSPQGSPVHHAYATGAGAATSVSASSGQPATAAASPSSTSSSQLTLPPSAYPAPSASPPAPAVVEVPSVGKFVASLHAQFAHYIRLALFPPSPATLARASPAALAAAASASPTGADLSLGGEGSTVGNITSSGTLSADLFPPGMYAHVHDVLSCIERIRSLPRMPPNYTSELRLLGDQLTSLYLDHHVRELLQSVASLHREETWEVDAQSDAEHDVLSLLGSAGAALLGVGESPMAMSNRHISGFVSFASASASASSAALYSDPSGIGGGLSLSLGHGHAGSAASNAPFQVTLLPSLFRSIVSSALGSFEALPCIQEKWVVERIVAAVFEAMRGFADGQHALMGSIVAMQNAQGFGNAGDRQRGSIMAGGAGQNSMQPSAAAAAAAASFQLSNLHAGSSSQVSSWTRPNELDRRLLLLWSNILHMQDAVLHPLLDQLLSLLPLSVQAPLDSLFEREIVHLYADVLEQGLVAEAYKRSKGMQCNRTIRRGYFKSGVQWRRKPAVQQQANGRSTSSAAAPFRLHLSVRSCVLELLLQLVLVHDEVIAVRRNLVDDVLENIVEEVAMTFLHTVGQIELSQSARREEGRAVEGAGSGGGEGGTTVCDVHGANQFLLELEFLSHTLDYYLTDAAATAFDSAKDTLAHRLAAEAAEVAPGAAAARQAIVQACAESRAHAMQHMQQSTGAMFACFAPTQLRKRH